MTVEIFNKLVPSVKKQWLEALRSGKYKQSRNRLRGPRGFCCLGVVCNVIDPSGWDKNSYQPRWHGTCGHISSAAMNKMRLEYGAMKRLIHLNDVGKRNFKYIADWIEKNL